MSGEECGVCSGGPEFVPRKMTLLALVSVVWVDMGSVVSQDRRVHRHLFGVA